MYSPERLLKGLHVANFSNIAKRDLLNKRVILGMSHLNQQSSRFLLFPVTFLLVPYSPEALLPVARHRSRRPALVGGVRVMMPGNPVGLCSVQEFIPEFYH